MQSIKSLIVFFAVTASSAMGQAEEAKIPRTVSVTGTAVTKVAPDIIAWNLSVTDSHQTLLEAKHRNDEKLQRIFDLRDELDLEPDELETGHLSIQREYERDKHGNRGAFKHFVVRRAVKIRQTDFERFDEFFEKLVSSAEMEVGFSTRSSRIHEVRAETRLKAMEIAKKKAAALAEVAGAKLGNVMTIDEHRLARSSRRSNFIAQREIGYSGEQPTVDETAGTFAPGSIEVKITVSAVFEME